MNRTLIILACLFAGLSSCSKYCSSTAFKDVVITRDISPDSIAHVITYPKGDNFQNPIDSASVQVTTVANGAAPYGTFTYDFSNTDKDYFIRLLPSGETHKITNIRYGHEKDHNHGGGNVTVCSYGCTIDGNDDSNGTSQMDKAPDFVHIIIK